MLPSHLSGAVALLVRGARPSPRTDELATALAATYGEELVVLLAATAYFFRHGDRPTAKASTCCMVELLTATGLRFEEATALLHRLLTQLEAAISADLRSCRNGNRAALPRGARLCPPPRPRVRPRRGEAT
ncbi:hypothetical protein [Nocardia wallacei]|uniref:hypothetical protein n=1 Tax=Nocardia wallacei TaxID=480035 RepID=UPI0024540759|nr:hypothetical protein [Nocardia wallacei]